MKQFLSYFKNYKQFSWDFLPINIIFLIIAFCLYQGINQPLISFNQFKFFGNKFSVLSGIEVLKQNNQVILYWVVLLFSVIFPIIKLSMMFFTWNTPYAKWKMTLLHWMILVARWSMLDVMIVAVLVAWVKIDMIADVNTHDGLSYFVFAVFAITLVKIYITWRIKNTHLKSQKVSLESKD